MVAGFAEGFWAAIEAGALDEQADAWVAGSEGGELFELGKGFDGEFVDGSEGIDFYCVYEVLDCDLLIGDTEELFDETGVGIFAA